MSEDLEAVLRKTLQDAIQETEKADHEGQDRDFYNGWLKLREEVLVPMLATATKVLRERYNDVESIRANGAIRLTVMIDGQKHTLCWTPDKKTREVVCALSAFGEETKPYPLEALDAKAFLERIGRFIRAVGRGELNPIQQAWAGWRPFGG